MKRPRTPPKLDELIKDLEAGQIQHLISDIPTEDYLHWDQLRHLTPPVGLTHRTWWLGIKLWRKGLWKELPLSDRVGMPFRFLVTDSIFKCLHRIDLGRAGGRQILDGDIQEHYAIDLMIEEAITSSQLEGASTTRQVARNMLRVGRSPRDRSEQMILNNYRAMKEIGMLKAQPLTLELVLHLHQVVMENTLDDSSGRFRYADESVSVVDNITGDVLHHPPSADELPKRVQAMCDFANGKTPDEFIHPALRAIMLHFWLAYDHPFVDGNGRTARALFYWFMLRNGYSQFAFLSISQILRNAPARYSRSFLYTETDDNDLTYFILHQLEAIEQAMEAFDKYIEREKLLAKTLDQLLTQTTLFNARQQALLSHALRHPTYQYTIYGHQNSHNVVYQTARTDLLDLQKYGLLEAEKIGKQWVFKPVEDLVEKLRAL